MCVRVLSSKSSCFGRNFNLLFSARLDLLRGHQRRDLICLISLKWIHCVGINILILIFFFLLRNPQRADPVRGNSSLIQSEFFGHKVVAIPSEPVRSLCPNWWLNYWYCGLLLRLLLLAQHRDCKLIPKRVEATIVWEHISLNSYLSLALLTAPTHIWSEHAQLRLRSRANHLKFRYFLSGCRFFRYPGRGFLRNFRFLDRRWPWVCFYATLI